MSNKGCIKYLIITNLKIELNDKSFPDPWALKIIRSMLTVLRIKF